MFTFQMNVIQQQIEENNEKPKTEPKIKLGKFSPDGKISFKFDQDMLVPDSLKNFTLTTDSIMPQARLRSLDEAQKQAFAFLSEFMEFTLERGSPDSAPMEDLMFTIKLIEFNSKRLVLQALFDKPLSVSIGSSPDIFRVEIVDPTIFVGQDSGKTLPSQLSFETPIPRLFNDEKTFEIVTTTEAAFEVAYQMSSTTMFVLALLINFSLKPLWIFKNVMQVIVHCRILRQLPANLMSALEQLNFAAELKPHFLLAEKFLRRYVKEDFGLDQTKSLVMQKWGIEDESYFWSLGIFAVFLILLIALTIIYGLLRLLQHVSKKSKSAKWVTDYLDKKLFFNGICRFMIESYMTTVHNTLIFLVFSASLTSAYEQAYTIGLSIIMALLLIWPAFTAIFLTCWSRQLDDKKFKFRFDSLYLEQETDNYLKGLMRVRRMSYCYCAVFSTRRLALVFCIFFLKEENFVGCILGLITIQILYLFYMIDTRPHIDGFYNSLEFFNEAFILLLFYSMLSFSTSALGPLVNPDRQWSIGFVSIAFVCAIYIANFSLMLREVLKKIKQLYWKIVKYMAKKKQKAKNKHKGKVTLRELTRIVNPELVGDLEAADRPREPESQLKPKRKKSVAKLYLRRKTLSVIAEEPEFDSFMQTRCSLQDRKRSRATTMKKRVPLNVEEVDSSSSGSVNIRSSESAVGLPHINLQILTNSRQETENICEEEKSAHAHSRPHSEQRANALMIQEQADLDSISDGQRANQIMNIFTFSDRQVKHTSHRANQSANVSRGEVSIRVDRLSDVTVSHDTE